MIFFNLITCIYLFPIIGFQSSHWKKNTETFQFKLNQNKNYNIFTNKSKKNEKNITDPTPPPSSNHKYPITRPKFVEQLKRLNSKNRTIQNQNILGGNDTDDLLYQEDVELFLYESHELPKLRIILDNSNFSDFFGIKFDGENGDGDGDDSGGYFDDDEKTGRRKFVDSPKTKSKNFEVYKQFNTIFKDVGGYDTVKQELNQCIDILKNYKKYAKYNVRIPRGLLLEGPPGTGKTLLAKALAGESNCNFIPVAGSDFQEKYVGVGSTRVKELFQLAKSNTPCIIFIDEIDALGRKRSSDGESSSGESDNTLNALLVELDGFKNNTGVFIVCATNRADLLDSALTRPGRIDKKIYIGLPDTATREAIINIHIKGKPCDKSIVIKDVVDVTEGYSGAQIENLLNEAMLNALRYDKTKFTQMDLELVLNKMMAGWQPNEHEFTSDIIDRIAIHEMGHAVVGIFSRHHSNVSKVVINLSSPQSPGYTVFEGSTSNIYIREALFEHLMILLAGRIAEEAFYDVSVTTGAINDFEEALKLAEKMILYYGMGSQIIYPRVSEKYKELIDNEVSELISEAYRLTKLIITDSKELIYETSEILKRDKLIKAVELNELVKKKYMQLYLDHCKI